MFCNSSPTTTLAVMQFWGYLVGKMDEEDEKKSSRSLVYKANIGLGSMVSWPTDQKSPRLIDLWGETIDLNKEGEAAWVCLPGAQFLNRDVCTKSFLMEIVKGYRILKLISNHLNYNKQITVNCCLFTWCPNLFSRIWEQTGGGPSGI